MFVKYWDKGFTTWMRTFSGALHISLKDFWVEPVREMVFVFFLKKCINKQSRNECKKDRWGMIILRGLNKSLTSYRTHNQTTSFLQKILVINDFWFSYGHEEYLYLHVYFMIVLEGSETHIQSDITLSITYLHTTCKQLTWTRSYTV